MMNHNRNNTFLTISGIQTYVLYDVIIAKYYGLLRLIIL